ncbi:hypothetical protein N7471_002213 [Penicillium samsonianum]|uniref:uncharacterized protein n=1 Tax=Penicillium samsonianum TaxID=1882272 RepID=UPI002547D435|nr:uncharacterized protein N7471_002213 [Penicillium samsonianum]KAJ6142760.1 hypothetical protein N7471_002213 [Penicillium samsonianum]
MSGIRLPRQLYPWLPDHFRHLYQWLNSTEPTWGYTIYRTTYTPQSHASFPRMVDLTTAYIKKGYYDTYESCLRYEPNAAEFERTPFDEMWAKYKPRVIEDASQFDGASIDQVRAHFKAWATKRNKLDRFPSYRMFIVIDEESFRTLQNAPLPDDLPKTLEDRQRHYVKVIEALEEDSEPPFPGWMKCSLSGIFDLWPNMQEGSYLEESYSLRPYGTDVY